MLLISHKALFFREQGLQNSAPKMENQYVMGKADYNANIDLFMLTQRMKMCLLKKWKLTIKMFVSKEKNICTQSNDLTNKPFTYHQRQQVQTNIPFRFRMNNQHVKL